MGQGIWILGIVALVGIFGFIAYNNSVLETIDADLQAFYNVKKECVNNNCISLLLPKKAVDEERQDVNVETTETHVDEDTSDTSIVSESENIKVQKYALGNIPPIEGYVKLYDPNTNEPIKPYIYDAFVLIECSELNEFCNMDSIAHRTQTSNGGTDEDGNELGGYFSFDWSHWKTQGDIIPNIYDKMYYDVYVKVDSPEKIVSTSNMNEGRYEVIENDYTILITR